MFLWELVTSIFWAFVIAIMLWIVCAFSGKLVNSSFRMSALLHLLCFAIAVPTIALFTVIFTCNKAKRMVTKAEATVINLLMNDKQFVDQFHRHINKASSTANTDVIKEYLAENFSERISSEYPMLEKYLDTDQLLQNIDLDKQKNDFIQNPDGINAGKIQEIMQAVINSFTIGIRSKIRAVQRNLWFVVILLQAVSFGIVFHSASKYRNQVNFSNIYESNEYL